MYGKERVGERNMPQLFGLSRDAVQHASMLRMLRPNGKEPAAGSRPRFAYHHLRPESFKYDPKRNQMVVRNAVACSTQQQPPRELEVGQPRVGRPRCAGNHPGACCAAHDCARAQDGRHPRDVHVLLDSLSWVSLGRLGTLARNKGQCGRFLRSQDACVYCPSVSWMRRGGSGG